MSRRYVIVGSGVAAVSAAQVLAENDPRGTVTLVSDDPHGYYSRPGLAYYLADEITEPMLYPFPKKTAPDLPFFRLSGKVIQVLPEQHRVFIQNGQPLAYDRLLLATGAQAVLPPVPGIDLDGVVKLDHLEDARRILHLVRRAKTAVVVGGGITALEIAEGLHCRGLQVHYFMRGDRYWSNVLDPTESSLIEDRLKSLRIHLHFHTELESIEGERGRVKAVITKTGERFACGLVAFAIGVRPRLELPRQAGLAAERGILVNCQLQTAHPDIFAAGDVAQIVDPATGKSELDTLWNLARQQGRTAGINMSGGHSEYHKVPSINNTRLAGVPVTVVGPVGGGRDEDLVAIARGDSESWRLHPDAEAFQGGSQSGRMRLLVDRGCLIGALLIGDQGLAPALRQLITEGTDLTPIITRLQDPQTSPAELIADFCAQRRIGYANKFA